MEIRVPPWLAEQPRDRRGFIVPAEAGWDDDGPHIESVGNVSGLGLAFTRSCAVCGFVLPVGQPVWRIFNQLEAAARRQMRDNTLEAAGPGHLTCMLYSALVCPFWSQPQARLGKDSATAPGARRGTLAAILGYEDYLLAVPENVPVRTAEYLYLRMCGDIKFRDPAELLERYLQTLASPDVAVDGARAYWTNTTPDQKALRGSSSEV